MKIIDFLKYLFISKAYAALPRIPWGFEGGLLRDPDPENYDLYDVLAFVGNIIFILMSLAGAIAIIYIIIGGYKYIMSAGNPEGIQQAKTTLLLAVVGLIICLIALALIRFVWGHIITGVQLPENIPGSTPAPSPSGP